MGYFFKPFLAMLTVLVIFIFYIAHIVDTVDISTQTQTSPRQRQFAGCNELKRNAQLRSEFNVTLEQVHEKCLKSIIIRKR